jgi:hypothetical protein
MSGPKCKSRKKLRSALPPACRLDSCFTCSSSTLTMKAVRSSETTVSFYRISLRRVPGLFRAVLVHWTELSDVVFCVEYWRRVQSRHPVTHSPYFEKNKWRLMRSPCCLCPLALLLVYIMRSPCCLCPLALLLVYIMGTPCCLAVCPPKLFIFCAVRVVWKESSRLVPVRTLHI